MASGFWYRNGRAHSGRGPMTRIRQLASVLVVSFASVHCFALASVLLVSLAAKAPAQTAVDAAPGAEPLRAGVLAADQAMEPEDVACARFETPGGVLSIHEIAPAGASPEDVATDEVGVPGEVGDRPDAREQPAQFLVFWLDGASSLLYVYEASVAYADEFGVALRSLERELGVSMDVTTAANPWLSQIVSAADESDRAAPDSDVAGDESDGIPGAADVARWLPATRDRVRVMMGLWPTGDPDPLADQGCDPTMCVAREGFDVDGPLDAEPVSPNTPIESGEPARAPGGQGNHKTPIRTLRDDPGEEEPVIMYACDCGGGGGGCQWDRDCRDSDPCTTDYCSGGHCYRIHGSITGPPCADDGRECTDDYCIMGYCEHPPRTGAVCSANTGCPVCFPGHCTEAGICASVGVSGPACDCDGNPCTRGQCQIGWGCVEYQLADGSGCTDDGNECTDDVCSAGSCGHYGRSGPCDEDDQCTVGWCVLNGGSGSCAISPRDCDDGSACNGVEGCDSATGCVPGTPIDCDDANECTFDSCLEPSGDCAHTPIDCDDGAFCNGVETCNVLGGCVPGQNPCVGQHCNEVLDRCEECADGLSCDDGNWCTVNDVCVGTVCQGGAPRDCSDGIACTRDDCDNGACSNPDDLTYCSDGDPCTADTCNRGLGTCEHGEAVGTHDGCTPQGALVSSNVPLLLFVNNDDDNGNGIADYDDRDQMGMVDNELENATFSASTDTVFSYCSCEDTSEYHEGFVDEPPASLDVYLTNTMTGDAASTDPPTTPFFVGAHAPGTACGTPIRFGLHCCSHKHNCLVESTPIVAVMVHTLTWEKGDATNADLCSCPNNGGLQIFPGKLSPTDGSPNLRRQVKLVATLAPPIAGVDVYFRVFDVDDPFDQLNACDPADPDKPCVANVGLIDSNTSGPDNRPTPEPPRFYSVPSDENGQASITVTVTMQPGNNYRAAASVIREAVQTQIDQGKADALSVYTKDGKSYPNGSFAGYKVPVVWSPMLTVWRKLHVETDSMVRPTFVQNTWLKSWGNPTPPLTEPYVGLPSPPWYEIQVADPVGGSKTGQFNGGFIELNSTLRSRVFEYYSSAGDDEVIVQFANGLGGTTGGVCVFGDDDLADEPTFAAGVYGCDDGYATGSVLNSPDLSVVQLRYYPAYIDPVHEEDVSGTGGLSSFQQNVEFGLFGGYGRSLWDQANSPVVRQLPVPTSDYWTVLAFSSWQAETGTDGDPDTEELTNGISTHGTSGTTSAIGALGANYSGMCTIFKALMIGESDIPERYTVAHEIGHTLGLPHTSTGLMFPAETIGSAAEQSEPFSAESLRDLRKYDGP